nr:hypothetical protein CFP56_00905 [Quercus suber]
MLQLWSADPPDACKRTPVAKTNSSSDASSNVWQAVDWVCDPINAQPECDSGEQQAQLQPSPFTWLCDAAQRLT